MVRLHELAAVYPPVNPPFDGTTGVENMNAWIYLLIVILSGLGVCGSVAAMIAQAIG